MDSLMGAVGTVDALEAANVLSLIGAFFDSFQAKTMLGLILADVVLGIARALRTGQFRWVEVATFYRTMVVPYLLGYATLFLVVNYIIPPVDEVSGVLNLALVNGAWVALVGSLLASIKGNIEFLYRPPSEDEEAEFLPG